MTSYNPPTLGRIEWSDETGEWCARDTHGNYHGGESCAAVERQYQTALHAWCEHERKQRAQDRAYADERDLYASLRADMVGR